ncbi:hypothetical protein BD413DRAFT_570157 [Trametes elegans]|nr:hypothetical protein BD413DRAFT_577610 [Trametes elegans]KAI0766338.1 hypothetical protein BD413DRAFT_570157 [Trametes elegans]
MMAAWEADLASCRTLRYVGRTARSASYGTSDTRGTAVAGEAVNHGTLSFGEMYAASLVG